MEAGLQEEPVEDGVSMPTQRRRPLNFERVMATFVFLWKHLPYLVHAYEGQ